MPRSSAASKARTYLVEGRVVLERVEPDGVVASVRGDGAIHRVTYAAGIWACTCPALIPNCCHCIGVRLVTAPDLQEAPSTRKDPRWPVGVFIPPSTNGHHETTESR